MRGNKHTFLGMNIEIKYNTIQIDKVEQLEECIEFFGEDVTTSITSPATKKLFGVREDSKQLCENKV